MSSTERESQIPRPVVVGGFLAGWLGLALFLFQPHVARPFDVVDFPEFLPLLQGAPGPWEGFGKIVSYYGRHGRFNVLDYALITAKWELFGNSTVAWQLTGAAIMGGMAALLYLLLRRLGSSALGAGLASTLVLCSLLATPAWLRLSIRESLGSIILYAGMIAATNLHGARRWVWVLVSGASAAIGMILLKEMLIAALPGLWFIGATYSPSPARDALRSRRALWFAAVLLGASALATVPVAIVALRAPAEAYAAGYGTALAAPSQLLLTWIALLVPFAPAAPQHHVAILAVDLAFVLLLLFGCRLYLRADVGGARARTLVGFALVFPLLCVLAYVPWPSFRLFYGIPFVLGTALLVALSVTGIQHVRPRFTWLAVTAWLWVTVYMATQAHAVAREFDASVRMLHRTVEALETTATHDSIVYTACGGLRLENWVPAAGLLERVAAAEGRRHAPLVATDCEDMQRRVPAADSAVALLVFSQGPFTLGLPSRRILQPIVRFEWNSLSLAHDTIRAELVVRGLNADARQE